MKVLVLGGNGQLGKCLKDNLIHTEYEILFTSRKEIDISKPQDTKKK